MRFAIRPVWRAWLVLMPVLAVPFLAYAAGGNVNGTVRGVVANESGQGLANAVVNIANDAVGLERTVTTGADGQFQITLPNGTYTLEARLAGYKTVQIESVNVLVGEITTLAINTESSSIEEVVVYGSAESAINTAVAETSLSMSLEEVAMLPVSRSIESVALLAPGTVFGDVAFGEDKTLVSFNGASVAENVYFIDGLNVTNFRNGLGGSSVPFEFYDQFQIKTGGYSAEFGRSTGGVINAVTKKGTNEFEFGVVTYFEPELLRGESPTTLFRDGDIYDFNGENTGSSWTTDVYAGGPILEDRLFFFALYEFQDEQVEFTSRGDVGTFNEREIDGDFWGGNLLWNINDRHSLGVTAFSDERELITEQSDYDLGALSNGPTTGTTTASRGGTTSIIRYDGQITDRLFVSALYGKNEYDLTDNSDVGEQCPSVVNVLSGGLGGDTSFLPGCWTAFRINFGNDEREAYRLDLEFYLGNHTIRAGFDNEVNTSISDQTYSGTGFRDGLGIYYLYQTASVGTVLPNGGIVPDANGDGSPVDIVRWRISDVGGTFETQASAWYIEDRWDINDQWSVSLGVRNETFENNNGLGSTFVEIDDQLAPRIGVVWSPNGTGNSRAYANWGRYHLPVANNTNVRLSGAENGRQRYYLFDGAFDPVTAAPTTVDGNGLPTTQEIGTELVTANGVTPDSSQLADQSLEPMYQDEFIIGYEQSIGDNWLLGIRYVDRELASGIDDVLIIEAVEALGYELTGDADGYVLTNPGTDITIPYDRFDTGQLELTTFPADLLGYPEAQRTYEAVEITVERAFVDRWSVKGSYTWSKNEGNTEGYVKSDNGQDDAGITTDFDQTQLMDGAFGYLPNDRRHKIKVFGNYQLTDRLTLGANLLMQSGRPINIFGDSHPDGPPSYGATYYLTDPDTGELRKIPRGTAGRTPWITRLDLSAIYAFEWGDRAEVELRAEVFNLFNADSAQEVYETGESLPGTPDPRVGLTTTYQVPRYLRFGAAVRF